MPSVAPDQRVASPPLPGREATALPLLELPLEPRPGEPLAEAEQAWLAGLQSGKLALLEEAQACAELARTFGWRQEDIGQAIGRSRAAVANRTRLLDLAPPVQEALRQGWISVGHAKVLLGVKEAQAQAHLCEIIHSRGLTVRAAERLVEERRRREPGGAPLSRAEMAARAAQHLSTELETPVRIIGEGENGRIEIDYQGIDDLQRLLNLLGLEP